MTSVSLALCLGCERKSDFITETSPFAEVVVPTPMDGKTAIRDRAERFAKKRAMKVHFNPHHFEPQEFSLSLTRTDLNITAVNVLRDGRTVVRAYARSVPTSSQRAEVGAYLCQVMRQGCSS